MTTHPGLVLDEPTFLDWVERQERRYELVDGRPVMMTGGTHEHARLVLRIGRMLDTGLDQQLWAVMPSDFAVRVGPRRIRYPDVVVVESRDLAPGALSTDRPRLVVEVLSRWTSELDLGTKAHEYLRLPSLEAYLVFSQHRPAAHVWVRESGAFPAGPVPVEGWDAAVAIPQLGLTLPLGAVYDGILARADDQG